MRTFIIAFGILLLFTMSLSAKKIEIKIIIDDSVVYEECFIKRCNYFDGQHTLYYYSAYGTHEYGDEEVSKFLRKYTQNAYDGETYSKAKAKRLVAASIKALVDKGVCKKFR